MRQFPNLTLGALAVVAVATCAKPAEPPATEPWVTGTMYPSPEGPTVRGFLDRRGLIHAHSIYSHDACDGEPVDDAGVRNEPCLEDFRRDLCAVQHDFVFLTDHSADFANTEFPEVTLYRPAQGDTLLERDDKPVANWLSCGDGRRALIIPGTESGTMPVGLEAHVVDAESRIQAYRTVSPEAIALFRQHGAVTLLQHTEDWTPERIVELGVDGFEMFNVHANTVWNAGAALEMLVRTLEEDAELMHPNLVILPLAEEHPSYLETWAKVLARGHRVVTTMGSDCHRNSFPQIASDGERIDSYRRAMHWFSNHLLVEPDADGGFDDRSLKDALRAGRLYGVFEALGFADGFDYRAEAGAGTTEMGGEVALADAPVLHVSRPSVKNLDPARTPPALKVRLLRATEDGWVEVAAATNDDLAFTPTEPGAYRAEVRMDPLHLREELRGDAAKYLGREWVWIYANAIHVR